MEIIKRNGQRETLKLEKIVTRIRKQAHDLDLRFVDVDKVAITVVQGLFEGATTRQIDELTADSAASLTGQHPDYARLAARIAVSSLHKDTSKSFYDVSKRLFQAGRVTKDYWDCVRLHRAELEEMINYERDFDFDYFGFKTLENGYLQKIDGQIVERPQHLWMRVAVGIWSGEVLSGFRIDYLSSIGITGTEGMIQRQLADIRETYEGLSQGRFTHATPTLFNAGTNLGQLASCFLLKMDDSLPHIYKTLADTSAISKNAGGIGISISDIRAKGAHIKGTNGKADGIVPMLRVFNETARYVNQGGKRKGAFAVYLEPWHADVFDFLELRKPQGKEEARTRDLFMGLWVPDRFMQAVQADGDWHLFCPSEAPGLHHVYGEAFDALYDQYVAEGKFRKVVRARELWMRIMEAQQETGMPYISYKDSINQKSNQKNVGIIKSSNLCAEIVEYTDKDETAVCNLASVALPKFASREKGFDFPALYRTVRRVARNLNRVIDVTSYPTPETRRSNLRHRPIGIGVQGLADVFALLEMPFDSVRAKNLNRAIAETIYFAALTESVELAKEQGPYETFAGSPASEGILQFDLWKDRSIESRSGKLEITSQSAVSHLMNYPFDELKAQIKQHGLRNSLLVAPMPTASTSQILGNNECFEPYTTNIYTRRTLSGEFVVVNKHLVKALVDAGLWNESIRLQIIQNDGSVQGIAAIPEEIQLLFKTAWELRQRDLIEMAADRGKFTCQAQSMNLFFANPNFAKLSSAQQWGWLLGLKTGVYYTRTKSIVNAIKSLGVDFGKTEAPTNVAGPVLAPFIPETLPGTIEPQSAELVEKYGSKPIDPQYYGSINVTNSQPTDAQKFEEAMEALACSLDNPEACGACSA